MTRTFVARASSTQEWGEQSNALEGYRLKKKFMNAMTNAEASNCRLNRCILYVQSFASIVLQKIVDSFMLEVTET